MPKIQEKNISSTKRKKIKMPKIQEKNISSTKHKKMTFLYKRYFILY